MKEKLIIVGTGGMAPEVVYFVEKYDLFDIQGFSVDKQYMVNSSYMERPVFPLEELEKYIDVEDVKIFVAISWYNYMNKYKRQKFEYLKEKGFHFANLISPLASVNSSAMGEGNWIMDFVYIGYKSNIGDNNTFCSHSLLGHGTTLGNHNVFSGGARVAGNNTIGNQNYFGFCSIVFNKLSIGNKCLIGGGSIVNKVLSDFIVTKAPESHYKQTKEKYIESFLSPRSVELVNEIINNS